MSTQPAPVSPAGDEGDLVVRQAEQRRIAQMLHDSVSQSLSAAYLEALVLAQRLSRPGSDPAAEVHRLADRLHGVVVELREIAQTLWSEPESPPASVDRFSGASSLGQRPERQGGANG